MQRKIFLTDSRSLAAPADTLFFAIRTATNDGANYIPYLYGKGVRNFVVDNDYKAPAEIASDPGVNFTRVDDTLRALQRLATRPDSFGGEIVAVTGSRGKTVVKEWLYQMLEPLRNTVRSPRSFNSQIGVPLSMALIVPSTEVAVIEAGVSRKGEMTVLRDIIKPDTVIITNIGADHDDGFSSRDEKALEKLQLATGAETKTLIYSLDDPVVAKTVGEAKRNGLFANPDIRLAGWSGKNADAGIYIDPERDLKGRFIGTDAQNAGHAVAYMRVQGFTDNEISDALDRLHHVDTRLDVNDGINGCSIVFDSYTADISSLMPALDFAVRRRMPDMGVTVVMSDMRHGVRNAEQAYAEAARMMKLRGVTRFIGVGPVLMECRHCFDDMDSRFFATTDEMLKSLSADDFHNEIILIKGAPEFEFARLEELLESRTHETVLEVNLDAMTRNFNYFRSLVPANVGLVAMVKASGYGAGSYEIAKTLQDAGAAYLAVAVLDEGVDLRRQGITMPVMVMNPKVANYYMMFANRLEPNIYTFSMLRDVIEAAKRNGVTGYPIHIKLDTGMHRMGFVEEELPEVMEIVNAAPEVRIASTFSHLATADCPDLDEYTERQLKLFDRMSGYMLAHSKAPFMRHVLNTAGIIRYPQYHYDMVRLGIGLYGVDTLPPEMEKPLELVSALKTVIIEVREWPAGEAVGYSRKGYLDRPTKVATIPIGYADGMNRHFGNGAVTVRVNGVEAPTIGNICMDACMIDVTGIDCREGDTVEIFGPGFGVERLSDLLQTIPYEILTSVSPRVKRIYFRE